MLGIIVVLRLVSLTKSSTDYIQVGNEIIEDFYSRYNTTKEVDLVFILDRSGSVPRSGWASMTNFVKDILEHFTVDKNNTRVAIVTYSTTSTVDINDLEPDTYSDGENKCTLNRRIEDYIERKIPYGYTATYDALNSTYEILLSSRPKAKKAVFVLTDGKSNIGPPPVKVAFDLLSLQWDESWNETHLGPQVEIYAFGIEQAEMEELQSVASNLPNHVFLIPNFLLFEELARSLHGGKAPVSEST